MDKKLREQLLKLKKHHAGAGASRITTIFYETLA